MLVASDEAQLLHPRKCSQDCYLKCIGRIASVSELEWEERISQLQCVNSCSRMTKWHCENTNATLPSSNDLTDQGFMLLFFFFF